MARILLVSKPVAPPWNDSSKNLVRDVALGMERHVPLVLGRRGAGFAVPRGEVEPLYPASAGGFAPALVDNARVLSRLVAGRRPDLWHFFFAPNPRTSRIGAAAARLRRMPTVQTVCSAPRADADIRSLLFADVTVVLSRHTERRLVDAGVPAERLRRIPPAIPPLEVPTEQAREEARRAFGLPASAPLVVYAGDLEFGGGAATSIEALAHIPRSDAHLAVACRVKTEAARAEERRLRELVTSRGLHSRVSWVGETPRIHDLLAAADVVVLPSESLYAKMDHPLVLLEAMSMERPVVVARGTAAEELAEHGGATAVEPSADAVASSVGALLDDADARRALGRRAREHVLAHHDRGAMARAYETVYDALLADGGLQGPRTGPRTGRSV